MNLFIDIEIKLINFLLIQLITLTRLIFNISFVHNHFISLRLIALHCIASHLITSQFISLKLLFSRCNSSPHSKFPIDKVPFDLICSPLPLLFTSHIMFPLNFPPFLPFYSLSFLHFSSSFSYPIPIILTFTLSCQEVIHIQFLISFIVCWIHNNADHASLFVLDRLSIVVRLFPLFRLYFFVFSFNFELFRIFHSMVIHLPFF
jgi:hypothetical protein